MDMGTLRGLITLAVLVLFIALWAWSWSRKRQPDYDAAAELPLQDDNGQPPGTKFVSGEEIGKERNA